MHRTDLLALRERVVAKSGYPKLLAAIELMLLHHEPGYEHERHPAVRSYRVQSHIACTLLEAAANAEPEEKEQVERAFHIAYCHARDRLQWLERGHPELAAKVIAGPDSYKALGITPNVGGLLAPPYPKPSIPARWPPLDGGRKRPPSPTPGYRTAVSRSDLALEQMHMAEDALAEASERCRRRPTLRHRIDARIIRDQASQMTKHQQLWNMLPDEEGKALAEHDKATKG